MLLPFLRHCQVGGGLPLAAAVKVAEAPSVTVALVGCVVMAGATAAFTVKVLAVRSRRMPGWTLPVVGGLVFSLLVGLWLTSALWFFDKSGFPSF